MRIIYLDLDSMRPDHFGCYGYHRNTTPNMDRIAREGVRFSRAYCQTSPCVPSRASLVSGRFGIHHGAVTHWGPGSEFRFPGQGHHYWPDMPLLPRYLRQHGYRTISFSSFADRHQANWFYAGWSEMHNHTLKGGGETAEEVNAALLPWLRDHGADDNYFLHVQYWDPHRVFKVSQEWIDLMAQEPPPAWPDAETIAGQQSLWGPCQARSIFYSGDFKSPVPTMPDAIETYDDWIKMINGYDAAIRYMDDQIGKIFDILEEHGVLDDTAVIISADHGECMGEQGVYSDHVSAAEATHNIPMIVRWPGVTPGNLSYDGLMYNVDLHPTLCELLGIPTPKRWDGESFARALRGEPWEGRPYLVWDHALYSCQRAVRTDEWLYVRTYHPGLFDFKPVELYNMKQDPHQTTNVLEHHPDIAANMDRKMNDWLHEMIGHHGSQPDPMQEVIRTGPWKYARIEPWIKRLREIGQDEAAAAILRRLDLDENLVTRDGHTPM